MPNTLAEITESMNGVLDPAGWAFSIWGLIYTLLGLFMAYVVVPEIVMGFRNDWVIFYYILPIWLVNMLANTIWLPVFQTYTGEGFIFGFILLVTIWITNFAMMFFADHATFNWLEVLCVRLGLSIYTGWTTGATVLNSIYMFKYYGANNNKVYMGPGGGQGDLAFLMEYLNEEEWGVIIIWCVFVLVNLISFGERNPLYGSVLIWVSGAIFEKTNSLKPGNTMIWANSLAVMCIQIVLMGLWWTYLIFETAQNGELFDFIPYWDFGLFGKVIWDIDWTGNYVDIAEKALKGAADAAVKVTEG